MLLGWWLKTSFLDFGIRWYLNTRYIPLFISEFDAGYTTKFLFYFFNATVEELFYKILYWVEVWPFPNSFSSTDFYDVINYYRGLYDYLEYITFQWSCPLYDNVAFLCNLTVLNHNANIILIYDRMTKSNTGYEWQTISMYT